MFSLLLIFITFWSAIPGAVATWVMRENGRSSTRGLALGLVGGPVGVLCVLIFLMVAGSGRRAPSRASRAQRSYHLLPMIGPLHTSTVWILAGFTIFLCIWVLSGTAYEIYKARQPREIAHSGARTKAPPRILTDDALKTLAGTVQTDEPASAENMREGAKRPSSPTQNGFAVAAPQRVLPVQTESAVSQTDAGSNLELSETEESRTHSESSPAPTPNEIKSAPTPPPASRTRDAAVTAVKRQLLLKGHRVHASLSGDAQTATLSLTGATLSRETGNQLLGDRRIRESLKTSGVRIVVIVSGRGSWTYLL